MDIKTVDSSNNLIIDDLYQRQKENVSKMRTALLAVSDESCITPRQAIQDITGMRIYHQLIRIIRYTELMDKLETKLYESIEYSIDSANSPDPATWITLLKIQEKLQKQMIESHKLLQPYLDIKEFSIVELTSIDNTQNSANIIMEPEERDKLRSKAQSILLQLQDSNSNIDSGDM